ncbi:GntR family transcriptional regulator [Silicimonas sp. MF1-12-2]|uniref:GntR family transcriptional regulator n=1 Tax=Silicimonas sp. MF1-12-2 TaxID=3384793 RepID=UPI0039B69498
MTTTTTNTQRAADEMRRLIFSGDLAAGSDHLETELAERFGMSRTPVREAALILEAQGLVSVRPRRGVRILPVSPDDMAEIYDVLTELESHAAGRAAAAGHSEAELSGMARAIDDMDAAVAAQNREAWAEADDRFHSELVRLGRNRRIETIVAMMSDQVRRARSLTLYLRPLPQGSNDDHRAVLEAIRKGSAYTAQSIHRAHRERAKEMLISLLRSHRLNQV